MDIVVKGRNVEIPQHYRVHVAEKLGRLERYDRKVIRFDVELFHEPNPRQAKNCQRVEITGKGRGPVVRAEACAQDFYAALDVAVNKLENRLRRIHDRRKDGRRKAKSIAETMAGTAAGSAEWPSLVGMPTAGGGAGNADREQTGRTTVLDTTERQVAQAENVSEIPSQWSSDEPGRIVRTKEHPAEPMTVDQALYQMELVGHDFYLFSDADSGRPSVVYRRRGFDYGVISLV
ncbi:ribosome hibernation-promoting factor, HPF/YfiA family [Actinoalloteichus caeruleus]|uniref:Ribosome hibernation promoting factor n=1 Tax=Actinoalloteichus caeruleus DSM 43889 TaxID=1120930 RepID=A0ABT1JMH5_ACTCY|nr:ribosome-associated translation inhibitor RaiA [Actinoalloteichus caeruleus]MCP2333723.1 ribosomal subunit interface protein [Actinoalloteichus caeruleus DSM 43889]